MAGLIAMSIASCNVVDSPVTVVGNLSPSELGAIRDRCRVVSDCLNAEFGWSTPSAISVRVVSRLAGEVPKAPLFADGYSDRGTATIVIEQGAWRATPEVLSHELTHLALPESFADVTGPLLEGVCNLAALMCAQANAEADRLRVESIIAVFNATGGIAFDIAWEDPLGTPKSAQITFNPGMAAYVDSSSGKPEPPDPDRQLARTRNLVATFVLATVARESSIQSVLSQVRTLAHGTAWKYPELELARQCGIESVDDLRRAAGGEVDRQCLVQVIQHEAGWLYPRIDELGLNVRRDAQLEVINETIRISLPSSNVVATPADLRRASP